jgi:hypothetical protein
MSATGFLGTPEPTAEAQLLFDEDIAEVGYVMNISRLWAYRPALLNGLFDLMRKVVSEYKLTFRQRGILVAACASAFGDSYCALAWGSKLAAVTDADTASGVLRGEDDSLNSSEQAMAAWARKLPEIPATPSRKTCKHCATPDTAILRSSQSPRS